MELETNLNLQWVLNQIWERTFPKLSRRCLLPIIRNTMVLRQWVWVYSLQKTVANSVIQPGMQIVRLSKIVTTRHSFLRRSKPSFRRRRWLKWWDSRTNYTRKMIPSNLTLSLKSSLETITTKPKLKKKIFVSLRNLWAPRDQTIPSRKEKLMTDTRKLILRRITSIREQVKMMFSN